MSGKMSQQQRSNTDTHYAFVRLRIFALEYREVSFKKSLIRRLSEGPSISLEAPRYRFNNQVFGEEDSDNGDDESGEDNVEVDVKDIGLRESPLDLTDVNGGLGFQTSAFGGEGGKSADDHGVFIHQDMENESATSQ